MEECTNTRWHIQNRYIQLEYELSNPTIKGLLKVIGLTIPIEFNNIIAHYDDGTVKYSKNPDNKTLEERALEVLDERLNLTLVENTRRLCIEYGIVKLCDRNVGNMIYYLTKLYPIESIGVTRGLMAIIDDEWSEWDMPAHIDDDSKINTILEYFKAVIMPIQDHNNIANAYSSLIRIKKIQRFNCTRKDVEEKIKQKKLQYGGDIANRVSVLLDIDDLCTGIVCDKEYIITNSGKLILNDMKNIIDAQY